MLISPVQFRIKESRSLAKSRQVLFMERKYQEGAGELAKAVHLNPRLAESHFMLGLARYEL